MKATYVVWSISPEQIRDLIAEEANCSDILKTLNTVISAPTRDYLEGVLLSLVVIFTQSIQLSKIVERHNATICALGRLEHFCSRLNLEPLT